MADLTDASVAWNEVLPASAQEELRHMELMARRMVSALRHGMHRSRMLGVSTDFNHHKLYSPGDALKHMDWKASARHDRFYVKRYIEDRSLAVRIVLDGSGSMAHEADGVPSKYRQAARVAACLSYLVIKERDAVGLSLTSTAETTWLPVSSRSNHMLRILQVLAGTQAKAQDSLAAGLRVILGRNETRGIVAVITDLMYDPEPVRKALGRLHAQGHEVIVIQVRDGMEEDFPFSRWVQFLDLENQAVKHRLDAVLLKRIYREEYQALLEDWRTWARKFGMHYVSFRNEEDPVEALTAYLAVRARMGREK